MTATLLSASACDWCGRPFAPDERPVRGYDGKPTHSHCAPTARLFWQRDMYFVCGEARLPDREPFVDWPNGQGL